MTANAVHPDADPLIRAASLARRRRCAAAAGLGLGLLALAALSIASGAVPIPPLRVLAALLHRDGGAAQDALVILQIRLPRLLLGLMVGAALAVSGALMQGLFRNPLADPGLAGVSAGAGLAAAATIVLGERLPPGWAAGSSLLLLPAAAFLGALAAASTLYVIATRAGRTSVATMLLAGIALGAFASALAGLLTYLSDDRQLRDLAFWSLGSLGGATWAKVTAMAPVILVLLLAVPFLARGLNGILLGEAEAFYLGVPVQRIKRAVILLVAVAVGASVAAAGVISFVGLVIPHLLRLLIGPDHRALLPFGALAGACLLAGADILARTLVAPAELPIGILTAAVGAPFFLWLLLRRNEGLDD